MDSLLLLFMGKRTLPGWASTVSTILAWPDSHRLKEVTVWSHSLRVLDALGNRRRGLPLDAIGAWRGGFAIEPLHEHLAIAGILRE